MLSRYPCAPKICAPNDHLNTVSFYDALDNRIGMDENGTQTWTLYDGGNPVMDFNGSGSLTMRYLWGPTGIVARQTSGGTVSWYLADALGTVRDLINNSGAIIDHVDFSAFGTVLDESNPTNGDRLTGFAGMERDAVTGLNLAVYREENPGTGRWDSQDPLEFGGQDGDLYRYVTNQPTDQSDIDGLQQRGDRGRDGSGGGGMVFRGTPVREPLPGPHRQPQPGGGVRRRYFERNPKVREHEPRGKNKNPAQVNTCTQPEVGFDPITGEPVTVPGRVTRPKTPTQDPRAPGGPVTNPKIQKQFGSHPVGGRGGGKGQTTQGGQADPEASSQ